MGATAFLLALPPVLGLVCRLTPDDLAIVAWSQANRESRLVVGSLAIEIREAWVLLFAWLQESPAECFLPLPDPRSDIPFWRRPSSSSSDFSD